MSQVLLTKLLTFSPKPPSGDDCDCDGYFPNPPNDTLPLHTLTTTYLELTPAYNNR